MKKILEGETPGSDIFIENLTSFWENEINQCTNEEEREELKAALALFQDDVFQTAEQRFAKRVDLTTSEVVSGKYDDENDWRKDPNHFNHNKMEYTLPLTVVDNLELVNAHLTINKQPILPELPKQEFQKEILDLGIAFLEMTYPQVELAFPRISSPEVDSLYRVSPENGKLYTDLDLIFRRHDETLIKRRDVNLQTDVGKDILSILDRHCQDVAFSLPKIKPSELQRVLKFTNSTIEDKFFNILLTYALKSITEAKAPDWFLNQIKVLGRKPLSKGKRETLDLDGLIKFAKERDLKISTTLTNPNITLSVLSDNEKNLLAIDISKINKQFNGCNTTYLNCFRDHDWRRASLVMRNWNKNFKKVLGPAMLSLCRSRLSTWTEIKKQFGNGKSVSRDFVERKASDKARFKFTRICFMLARAGLAYKNGQFLVTEAAALIRKVDKNNPPDVIKTLVAQGLITLDDF
jgi:hypothetical protein